MARKCWIEAQVLIQSERKRAPRKLERPHIANFFQVLITLAGAHAEKRQVAPARKCLKMPAGVRHPIDLVKGIGKVRDAWDRSRTVGAGGDSKVCSVFHGS